MIRRHSDHDFRADRPTDQERERARAVSARERHRHLG